MGDNTHMSIVVSTSFYKICLKSSKTSKMYITTIHLKNIDTLKYINYSLNKTHKTTNFV